MATPIESERMLVLEMVKTSSRIVLRARRLGYLDRHLRSTGKPLETDQKGGVRGFGTTGLVYSLDDILAEVRFLTEDATRAAEGVGLDSGRVDQILRLLRKYRC